MFKGVTWLPAAHGIHNYVMGNDGNIMWWSSFSFSLVANFHVIFNTHEMFTARCPKSFSCGML